MMFSTQLEVQHEGRRRDFERRVNPDDAVYAHAQEGWDHWDDGIVHPSEAPHQHLDYAAHEIDGQDHLVAIDGVGDDLGIGRVDGRERAAEQQYRSAKHNADYDDKQRAFPHHGVDAVVFFCSVVLSCKGRRGA